MRNTRLSNHTFKKGKFITPFHTIPMAQELEDEKSWTYGRMPEYLWIGMVLNYFGREDGLVKIYSIISKLHHTPEALDEINLFWFRHIEEVQLYLRLWFPGEDSYVFTASTYLDYDDNEHL